MTLDTTTNFELPLPHPDNSPKTVDVPRLRAALTAIDGLLKELKDQADDLVEDKADKTQVATDIANAVSASVSDLLAGAPEAYDTLKEIADKLGDNDDVVSGILSQLGPAVSSIEDLQSGKADLDEDGKVPLTQLPLAEDEDAEAGTGTGLVNAGQVGLAIAALAGDVVLETFTASGTFTKEDDDIAYFVELWGGGGSGAMASSATSGGGGGGGAYTQKWLLAEDIGATVAVTIGAGGAAQTAVGAGNIGGDTHFGGLCSAFGGGGGRHGTGTTGGGGGGAISAGKNNGEGGSPDGGTGGAATAGAVDVGGNSVFGGGGGGIGANKGGDSAFGGGGGGGTGSAGGAGGVSKYGGSGGAGWVGANGTDGQIPGGGGGATRGSAKSGAGARGEVRVYRFKRIKQ